MFTVSEYNSVKSLKLLLLHSTGDATFMDGVKGTLEERNSLEIRALYRGKREGLREIKSNVVGIRQEKST
jgi:hypothetical protein